MVIPHVTLPSTVLLSLALSSYATLQQEGKFETSFDNFTINIYMLIIICF